MRHQIKMGGDISMAQPPRTAFGERKRKPAPPLFEPFESDQNDEQPDLEEQEDEEGQGLVEYALVILLVAPAIILMMTAFGARVGNMFGTIVGSF